MYLRKLWNKKDTVCEDDGKLSAPSQAGGDLATLGRYAGKAGKKAAEMGRFFLSEWLREPGAQKMLIGKAEPFLKKGIDQLSTAIRPKRAYKTNRKDLDGAGLLSNLAYGFNYALGQDRKKVAEWMCTKQLESYQSQQKDGHFLGTITQGRIIRWRSS